MSGNVHRLPLGTNQAIPDREDRDWVTGPELVTATGCTYRQLDYWARTGLLPTLDKQHPGHGRLRRYPTTAIDRTLAIRDLMSVGLDSRRIAVTLDDYLAHGWVDLGHVRLTRRTNGAAS